MIVSGAAPNVPSPVGGYYIVSVTGTPTIDGVSVWHAGDWIIWDGTSWSDVNRQVNPVSSVAGLQGAVITAQLATALAGSSGRSSAGGLLNVILGTTANTAAAGNDSRITGAAPTSGVYTYLANVAAIANYTGNSPALRTCVRSPAAAVAAVPGIGPAVLGASGAGNTIPDRMQAQGQASPSSGDLLADVGSAALNAGLGPASSGVMRV